MEQYHRLLKEILRRGDVQYEPRTQTWTLGMSAWTYTFDLRKGFPLMTTKSVNPRLPFEEVFWKLRGERNVKSLVDKNIHFWTANAFDRYLKSNNLREKFPKHTQEWNAEFESYKRRIAEDPAFAEIAGDLGPVYGYQWRHWKSSKGEEIDQLAKVLQGIRKDPGSRYHILNSWNVGDLPDMALGPCPFWHQFTVYGNNLDLTMVQRSCDVFLGVPFNDAQDALLLEMVAKETGLEPRFFNHHFINVHSYLGVSPRADFWVGSSNVREFQEKFKGISKPYDYIGLKEWYLAKAPEESQGNERKDHVPFILEQLSKTPYQLPTVELANIPLLEAIFMPVSEIVKVNNYEPQKWDSRAVMAA